jgi:hypothetical protein
MQRIKNVFAGSFQFQIGLIKREIDESGLDVRVIKKLRGYYDASVGRPTSIIGRGTAHEGHHRPLADLGKINLP